MSEKCPKDGTAALRTRFTAETRKRRKTRVQVCYQFNHLGQALPTGTSWSVVRVPVLSNKQWLIFPAKGTRYGSVQKMPPCMMEEPQIISCAGISGNNHTRKNKSGYTQQQQIGDELQSICAYIPAHSIPS